MRKVAAFSTPAEAQILVTRLQSAGIHAVTRDQFTVEFNWMISNAVGGVKVEVPDEEYEDALALCDARPLEEGLLCCPQCGSADVKVRTVGVFTALCIVLKLPIPMTELTVDCMQCHKVFLIPRKCSSET